MTLFRGRLYAGSLFSAPISVEGELGEIPVAGTSANYQGWFHPPAGQTVIVAEQYELRLDTDPRFFQIEITEVRDDRILFLTAS
jgi:hypothetical protein